MSDHDPTVLVAGPADAAVLARDPSRTEKALGLIPRRRRRLVRSIGVTGALAVLIAAGWVVLGTVILTVRYHYPLPWFDEWATIDLIRIWRQGDISLWGALFSKHNEHRILFPRLVFFADALWFAGQGWLSLWASLAVQATHAAMFAWLLARARPVTSGSWIVGAAVLGLMFGLGQVENFASGFQLQFFGVFAAATACLLTFGVMIERERAHGPIGVALAGSLGLATVATFTMANGILAPALLPVLGALARLRRSLVALTAGWAILLAVIYHQGQSPVGQGNPLARLWPPDRLFAYEAAYLGNVLQIDRIASPTALGCLALLVATIAVVRAARHSATPMSLAVLGAMLFVVLTGIVTASGRMEYGVKQALSSRYVTGAVMFWAATLCYWWIDPPTGRLRRPARIAVLVFAALLLFGSCRAERTGRRLLQEQYALQVRAGDVLLQGRDNPAALAAGAGPLDRVERLAPFLRERGISIFAGQAAGSSGSATMPSH